jgi:hypothetical protein
MAEKEYTEKMIEEQRYFQNMKELSLLKPSPGMNSKSAQIISSKEPGRLPVFLRSQQEIEKKKMKIENLKENLFLQEKSDDYFQKRSKSFNKSTFNNWMNVNQNWTQKKLTKIENLKKSQIEQKQEEERKNLVFTPKINPTSELIVNMKNGKERSSTPVHEKLYKKHEEIKRKIEFKQSAKTSSFTPKINKYPGYIIRDKMNISSSKEFFFEAESGKINRSISKNKFTPQSSRKNLISLQTTPMKTPKKTEANGSPLLLNRSRSVNDFSSIKKVKQENNLDNSNYNLDNTNNLYNLNVTQNLSWKSPMNTILPKTPTKLRTFKSKPMLK